MRHLKILQTNHFSSRANYLVFCSLSVLVWSSGLTSGADLDILFTLLAQTSRVGGACGGGSAFSKLFRLQARDVLLLSVR